MSPVELIVGYLMVHIALGLILWEILTGEGWYRGPRVSLATITLPQLIALYIVCGPFLWVYAIWRLLGMWGKRS